MSKPLTIQDLRRDPSIILEFYFRAMVEGYASKTRSVRAVARHPGSKQISYQEGPWTITDTWHVTPLSQFSGGATHIYFEGKLVWMMQYFGYYPEELIPFLKEALAVEYKERRFNGGRGPRGLISSDKKLIYNNRPDAKSFESFHGIETIRPRHEDPTPKNSGWHRYHGGLMI
jgi:hypothetical protein